MITQENYQKAKNSGYSDQEIMEFLSQKDPTFETKMMQAKEAGYTPEEVLNYFNSSPQKKESTSESYVSDFGKQAAQGFGIGALGTYGDVLDLFGLQAKETLPGEKSKYGREFGTLEKLGKNEVPSIGELMELSDEDISPRHSRLPSAKNVEELGEGLGLISEPKTAAGRYGRRIGKLAGGGASFGATGVASPIAAGIAGQTLEELGAPPWAQAAAEIIVSLKYAPKSNVPVSSKSKEVEKVIGDLRKSGYSEKDITLAKSALEERKILKKYSTLTPEVENSIQQGIKTSENLFKEQIKKGLPGYAEGGLPYLEEQASKVYQSMEELAANMPIKNKDPFRKSIENSINYMEKSALLPEEKEFIGFLKEGLEKVDKSETADFLTSFYRKLGKSGKWTDPKTKEHLLGLVQKGIKESFSESGPEAERFGKYFDATNKTWKHWINARDLMQTIEKAQNIDGTNFKKLSSILNDPKNHELARKVLGPEPLENIKSITKGAEAIDSLLKQIPKTDSSFQSLKILEGLKSLFNGDYKTLGSIITLESAKKLATSLLTDPEKQNIMKKIIVAAQNNAPQQAMILAQELIKTHSSQAIEKEDQPLKSVK